MKWLSTPPVYGAWYECFVFFPTVIKKIRWGNREYKTWAWLEKVECRAKPGMKGRTWYDYRPLGDKGAGV